MMARAAGLGRLQSGCNALRSAQGAQPNPLAQDKKPGPYAPHLVHEHAAAKGPDARKHKVVLQQLLVGRGRAADALLWQDALQDAAHGHDLGGGVAVGRWQLEGWDTPQSRRERVGKTGSGLANRMLGSTPAFRQEPAGPPVRA